MYEQQDELKWRLSRLQFLKLAGAGIAGAILTACGAPAPEELESEVIKEVTVQVEVPVEVEVEKVITATPAPEVVTVTVLDTEFEIAPQREVFHQKFMEEHPLIKIEYEAVDTARRTAALTLGLRSGNAPDVFQYGGLRISMPNVVSEGYVQPIGPYLSDGWMDQFPAGSFMEGINVFDGQIYSWPWTYNKGAHNSYLYYNRELFQKAGLDPDKPPTTWTELREYCRTITEAGNGEFYGFVNEGKETWKWSDLAGRLAETAGGLGGASGVNYLTGQNEFDTEAHNGAMDLLLGLEADGSTLPGFMSLGDGEGRPPVAEGRAAIHPSGIYCIVTWRTEYPGFEPGVFDIPVPDSGRAGYLHFQPPGANFVMSSQCEHPEAVGVYIEDGIASKEFYIDVFMASGRGLAPYPELHTPENIKDPLLAAIAGFAENTRTGPLASARNAEMGTALGLMKSVTPSYADILVGVAVGELPSYMDAARELSEKANAEIDRVVAAANAEGISITRDCWVFPNWDPTEDYTADDYGELPACLA